MNRKHVLRAPRNPVVSAIADVSSVVFGCAIGAVSFNAFMRPAALASGGVVGISVLVERLTGLEPAFFQWGINLGLLALAAAARGPRFAVKSALGSFLLPLFIFATRGVSAVTDDLLLAAVFAGAGLGLGIGLVFRGGATVGGLSILARLFSDATGASIGSILAFLDGLVIAAAGLLFGLEASLYALVVVFVMGRTMDLVRVGFGGSKLAVIVSEKHDLVRNAVLTDLDRGLTTLFGRGGFSGIDRPVLLTVMDPTEVVRFKTVIRAIDPDAFVIILDAHEVLGLGFRSRT